MYRAYEAMLNCLNALTSHTPWLKLFSYAGSNFEEACRPPAGPHVSAAAVLDTTTLNEQDLPAGRTAPGLCHIRILCTATQAVQSEYAKILPAARTQNASSRQEAQGLQERGSPLSTAPFTAAGSQSREQKKQGEPAGAPLPREEWCAAPPGSKQRSKACPRRRLSSC